MTLDRCEISDLPRDQCAHCGARPGDRIIVTVGAIRVTGVTRVDVFTSSNEPSWSGTRQTPPGLHLRGKVTIGCACGQPTRDNAFGCDDCATELARALADAAWIAEQLDLTITGQRAKRPGQSSLGGDNLWNDRAAVILHDLKTHLAQTVKICHLSHVRHQSPYQGLPANLDRLDVDTMARWLLWRVDGLMFSPAFADTLKVLLAIEKKALGVIDRPPDRMFLGMCELAAFKLCDGAVYVKAGDTVGKCRVCETRYDPEERRKSLERALDAHLVTAAEIADLAVYLGIQAPRESVRKAVNTWHKRKQLKAVKTPDKKHTRFRYGDVAPLLSAAYDKREAIR